MVLLGYAIAIISHMHIYIRMQHPHIMATPMVIISLVMNEPCGELAHHHTV